MESWQRNPRRRWLLLAGVIVLALGIGCGRVDLEDLTPEAVRTEQALNPPTATSSGSSGSPAAGQTPGSGGTGGADIAGGRSLYNTWCSGCHDQGRQGAPPIRGNTYDTAVVTPMLRNGTAPSGAAHVKYSVTDLNDKQVNDVVAFIAVGQ